MGCSESKPKPAPKAAAKQGNTAQQAQQQAQPSPLAQGTLQQHTAATAPRGTDPAKVNGGPPLRVPTQPSRPPQPGRAYSKGSPVSVPQAQKQYTYPGKPPPSAASGHSNPSAPFAIAAVAASHNSSSYVKSASPPPSPRNEPPKSPTQTVREMNHRSGEYPGKATYEGSNLPPPNVLLPSVKKYSNDFQHGKKHDEYSNQFNDTVPVPPRSVGPSSDQGKSSSAGISSSSGSSKQRRNSRKGTKTPKGSRHTSMYDDGLGARTTSMNTSVSQRKVNPQDSVFGAPSNAYTSHVGTATGTHMTDRSHTRLYTDTPTSYTPPRQRSPAPASPEVVHCHPCSVSPNNDYTETMYKSTRMVMCVPVADADLDAERGSRTPQQLVQDRPREDAHQGYTSPSQRAYATRRMNSDYIATPHRA